MSKAKLVVATSPMQGELITLYVTRYLNKLGFVPHTEVPTLLTRKIKQAGKKTLEFYQKKNPSMRQ